MNGEQDKFKAGAEPNEQLAKLLGDPAANARLRTLLAELTKTAHKTEGSETSGLTSSKAPLDFQLAEGAHAPEASTPNQLEPPV